MRRVHALSILTSIVFPALLGAASVTNLATCSGITTTGDPNAAVCSGSVVTATAFGSVTRSANTVTVSASTFSSYVYTPNFSQPNVVAAQAETLISDDLTTDGPLRAGLAEITFDDFLIQQNVLGGSWTQFTIAVNGVNVYSCVSAGGGMSQCPTSELFVPIQLGTDFTLQVDDVSTSGRPSFAGGISADFTVALTDPTSTFAPSVSDVAAVPEPAAAGLALAGLLLSAFVLKRRLSRSRASR